MADDIKAEHTEWYYRLFTTKASDLREFDNRKLLDCGPDYGLYAHYTAQTSLIVWLSMACSCPCI